MSSSTSVEEVAALLGAVINRLHQASGQTFRTVTPPPGLPSIFSTVNPIPCRELFDGLVSLRAILRTHAGMSEEEERKTHCWSLSGRGDAIRSFAVRMPSSFPSLTVAPSILQLLLKLLSISSSLAQTPVFIHSSSSSVSNNTSVTTGSVSKRTTASPIRITPPFSSQILRSLWVDCVLLCHRLSPLSSPTSFDGNSQKSTASSSNHTLASQNAISKILSIYMEYASANPKSAKAMGGTRVACLQVLNALFSDLCLGPRLSSHTDGVLNVCHRALKSAGAHDGVYRVEAVRCATAIAFSIRWDYLLRSRMADEGNSIFWCRGAMADPTILEMVKLLKRSAEDIVADVRMAGAELVCMISSMLIHHLDISGTGDYVCSRPDLVGNNPLISMEDILLLAYKNLDDESPAVAIVWAESLARCICTILEYHDTINGRIENEVSLKRRNQNGETDLTLTKRSQSGLGSNPAVEWASKFRSLSEARSNKGTVIGITCAMCTSLSLALSTLGNNFTKVGGETTAMKLGGVYSVGGRSVRIGIGTTIMFLIQLQSVSGAIGPNSSTNTSDVISIILSMIGKDLDMAVAQVPEKLFSLNVSDTEKGLTSNDVGLCTFSVHRIIRRGLSEVSSEGTQLYLLRDLSQLCLLSKGICNNEDGSTYRQLQVALIEISNLLSGLGEAATSALDDLLPALDWCLSSPDQTVRLEAALSYQTLAYALPSTGRKFIRTACDELQIHLDDIVSYVLMKKELKGLGRNDDNDRLETAHRIYSLHGYALALALVIQEDPDKQGSFSSDVIDQISNVAFTLIQCQYDKTLVTVFALGACECSLAGWMIISAVLGLGPGVVMNFAERLFNAWNQHAKHSSSSTLKLPMLYELKCLEAKLKSAVVFLKYCAHLLLTHEGALPSTVSFAETCLSHLRDDGILAPNRDDIPIPDHYLFDSARSSLLELFCWLPPGTYPLLTEELFTFATNTLLKSSLAGISCSISPILLTKEDDLLHGACFTRCDRLERTGGAIYLDENISCLKTEFMHVSEREAIIPFILWKEKRIYPSHIYKYALDESRSTDDVNDSIPTPLHHVGNWRRPASQSPSSRVRLIDASIHLFSVLFGMRNGLEQDGDIRFLEELVSTSSQNTKVLAVVSDKSRQHDSETIQINVAATMLSCLHSLPTAEACGDNIQTAGPPWMKRAASLLLKFLSSQFEVVRRAGVEGLAQLSSLGVVEDAYSVQSSIIHSLGSLFDIGTVSSVRKSSTDSMDLSKSSAILTIGCIQRTAWLRTNKVTYGERVDKRDELIGESVIIMMTRILQAATGSTSESDSLLVRTYFLQAWSTLVLYSGVFDEGRHSIDLQTHLMLKSIEIVEINFFAAWTMVACDESERMDYAGADTAFLAVLIRLIGSLARRINILRQDTKDRTLERFLTMIHSIVHASSFHSIILQEAMLFLIDTCITDWSLIIHLSPIIFQLLSPSRPQVLTMQGFSNLSHFSRSLTSEILSSQIISTIAPRVREQQTSILYLFTAIDKCWATQGFPHTINRFMLLPRNRIVLFFEMHKTFSRALDALVQCQRRVEHALPRLLSYLISLISGEVSEDENSLLRTSLHWQVKCEAIRLSILIWLYCIADNAEDAFSLQFDSVIKASCSAAMCSLDRSELFFMQGLSLQLLHVALRSLTTMSSRTVTENLSESVRGHILTAIKHSIASLRSIDNDAFLSEGLSLLFRSGCECLPILCELEIISDPVLFKRLLQPLIDTTTSIPVSRPKTFNLGDECGRIIPVVLASKVTTVSQLYMLSKIGVLSNSFFLGVEAESASRLRDFVLISAALACHSYCCKETSSEQLSLKKSSAFPSSPCIVTFTVSLFLHLLDVSKKSVDFDIEQSFVVFWLDPLLAVVIIELYNCLGLLDPVTAPRLTSRHQQRIIAIFYRGLNEVVRSDLFARLSGTSLPTLITATFVGVITPYFDFFLIPQATSIDISAMEAAEACWFILSLCQSQTVCDLEKRQIIDFLIPILENLRRSNHFQGLSDVVMKYIVTSMDHLLSIQPRLFDDVSAAVLLAFCIHELSFLNDGSNKIVPAYESAVLALLRTSFSNQLTSDDRQRCIIYKSAVDKRWKIWLATSLSVRNPANITSSVPLLKARLSNYEETETIQSILSAVAQLASDRAEYIPYLNFYLGHQIVEVLLMFGVCRLNLYGSRLAVCSDIIKFLILSFQFMDHFGHYDRESTLYLALVLELMVSIVQFNGLPNDTPNINVNADASLGRLCAQAFVSLARYSPSRLKESMMHLSIDQTLVVESAIRADIAGYVKVSNNTLRKKIDLKGYMK